MKIKKFGSTEQKVFDLTFPLANELGLDIWDIRLEKEGALWYLRVFIEKEEGITIEDCENLTRPLNKILDEEDPISQQYMLEVGSAGLERELVREKHFADSCNKAVRVHLIRPLDNEKEFIGYLDSFSKDNVTIRDDDGNTLSFNMADISYIRLFEEF